MKDLRIVIHAPKTVLMNRTFFIFMLLGWCWGLVIPNKFDLDHSPDIFRSDDNHTGTLSNRIVDIGAINSDELYFGTGAGLAKATNAFGEPQFTHFLRDEFTDLPRGASPALYVDESVIVVAGVTDTIAMDNIESMGTGMAVSLDNGESWEYYPQPVDEDPDDPETPEREIYFYTDWYGINVKRLAVTTEINNVTYDLTVAGDYFYSASWAGGVRRHKFRNVMPGENEWEILPLPEDNRPTMYCGYDPPAGYTIDPRDPNPNDPANSGNHNHKGFSVHAQGDSILWVGTANGINKGIIGEDHCISWEHYTADVDGISGNWVIGFDNQNWQENGVWHDRIWAITWSTNVTETTGVSFSDDGGYTWVVPEMVTDLGLKVYNIFSHSETVFICSDEGLYMSTNGYYWEKLSRPVEYKNGMIVEEIKSEKVYSVFADGNMIWTGTNDGLARTFEPYNDWEIFRFWNQPNPADAQNLFFAYPNPFYINQGSQNYGVEFVRFTFPYTGDGKIHIFDFNMKEISVLNEFRNINGTGEVFWNGHGRFGETVASGVYFCRLDFGNKQYWTKLAVFNL